MEKWEYFLVINIRSMNAVRGRSIKVLGLHWLQFWYLDDIKRKFLRFKIGEEFYGFSYMPVDKAPQGWIGISPAIEPNYSQYSRELSNLEYNEENHQILKQFI
jgi:hypothetical protein